MEQWREQRGLPLLDALRQDVSYGLRMLRRAPGFTAAVLLTLAIGIGANSAMFTVVNAVLLRPLPYADPGRLVTAGDRRADGLSSTVGYETVMDWRARSRSFEDLALMRFWQPTLVIDSAAERLPAVRVTWNYFRMMGIHPQLGRDFTPDDDRPAGRFVALLSDTLWRRRFNADPGVIGRAITLSDTTFRIVGVMPPSFEPLDAERYFSSSAEIWAPVGYAAVGDANACRSCQHLRAFGRLKPGVSIAQATGEMNAIRAGMRLEHPSDYKDGSIAIVPLRDAVTGGVGPALYVLLGAVAFVLLIACANVANLLLTRSIARQRELTLRTVLGAGRRRIVRQLLTESVMLSLAGGAAGIALAFLAVRAIGLFAPPSLPRLNDISIDQRVLAVTAFMSVVTGLLFGLGPALSGAGAMQARLAVDSRTSAGGRSRLRATLVIADLALALVLLAGAGLMLRTVGALARTTPGFDAAPLLSMQFALIGKAYADGDAPTVAFQQRLIERLRAIPGVESATIAGQIPFGGNADCRGFHVQGRMKPNTVDDPCIERYGVTPEYLRTFNVRVLAGRGLEATDTATAAPVLLVSQATARAVWGSDDPIGSRVRFGNATRGPWYSVVGVVSDVHHDDLAEPAAPAFYNAQTQFTDSYLTVVLKASSGDPAPLAAPARAVIHELDPAIAVYQVAPVASLIEDSTAQRLFVLRLLGLFAGIAVLLAAIGLYGVVSYGVAQRGREVGLRMALGAQRADVIRMVLSGGLVLIAAGLVCGVAAAAFATRALASLTFGVSPVDPMTFAGAAGILAAVALFAHWVPLRRALATDPAAALRSE